MSAEENINAGAREMADLLKDRNVEQFLGRLESDYEQMSPRDFSKFLKQVKANNDQDYAASKHIPVLVLTNNSEEEPVAAQVKYSGWSIPNPFGIKQEQQKNLSAKPIEQR